MKKKRVHIVFSMIVIAVIAITTMAKANSCGPGHGEKSKVECKADMKKISAKPLSLEKVYAKHFPMVTMSIDKALKAIDLGDRKTALAELTKAKKMMAMINKAISKLVKPKFANATCPIMGSPINSDKVAKNLIRDYKDQKVAFCCAGCPASWDKLSDATKDAKLAKAKPKAMENHSGHKH
jgi:23S rRNA pseudoU1915 N3-methylase RlmH